MFSLVQKRQQKLTDAKNVVLSRFKTNLRKEDTGVLRATIKQLLSEKREASVRERIEAEAANAAAAAEAAAAEAKAANQSKGLLSFFM